MRALDLVVSSVLALAAAPAAAEVSGASPSGFLVTHRHEVKAAPPQVFTAIGQIGSWWNGEHTYSGDAARLSLELRAGGCFCERWDAGSIEHARVIYVGKDAALRLDGALGPLQELAAHGILHFALKPVEGRTLLTVTYRVSGSADAGLERLSAPVDRVIGEQVSRLVSFVESGRPPARSP